MIIPLFLSKGNIKYCGFAFNISYVLRKSICHIICGFWVPAHLRLPPCIPPLEISAFQNRMRTLTLSWWAAQYTGSAAAVEDKGTIEVNCSHEKQVMAVYPSARARDGNTVGVLCYLHWIVFFSFFFVFPEYKVIQADTHTYTQASKQKTEAIDLVSLLSFLQVLWFVSVLEGLVFLKEGLRT